MTNADSDRSSSVRRLIPIPHFNKYHPDPSPASLRWLVYTNKNDFGRCVVRRGRRILIDEEQYFKWLDERNKKNDWE